VNWKVDGVGTVSQSKHIRIAPYVANESEAHKEHMVKELWVCRHDTQATGVQVGEGDGEC